MHKPVKSTPSPCTFANTKRPNLSKLSLFVEYVFSKLSPLRNVADCRKWAILDEIFYSRNLVMPEHAN